MRASRARNRFSGLEVTVVSDMFIGMSIGKWYDPISERWIAPPEAKSEGDRPRPDTETSSDVRNSREAQRIWNLLVDSARG